MKCTEFETRVHEYVDGELTQSVKAFEAHLESCDACRALYEETLELKTLLADLDVVALPDDFEATLHEKLIIASKDLKVLPFYKHKSIKYLSSIAAVAIVSFFAIKAGSLIPDFTSNNNSDVSNMNMAVSYSNEMMNDSDFDESMSNDMAEEKSFGEETPLMAMDKSVDEENDTAYGDSVDGDSADDEMADAVYTTEARVSELPEVSNMVTLTIGAPIHVKTDINIVLKQETAIEDLILFVSTYDLREFIDEEGQVTFYMEEAVYEGFSEAINAAFEVVGEMALDYSKDLADLNIQFSEKVDIVEDLKANQSSDSETLDSEEALLRGLKDKMAVVSSYEGYKKITISIEKE